MPSIHPNPSKRFPDAQKVRYRFDDGRAGAATFETLDRAKRFVRRINDMGIDAALESIQRTAEPQRVASGKTVTECVDFYIDTRSGITKGTRATYRAWLRVHIAPTIGRIRVSKLTAEDVAEWITAQHEEDLLSNSTMTRNHTLLSSSLKLAVKHNWTRENVATGVAIPRTLRKKRPIFLAKDECELVIKSVDEPHKTMVEFLLATGCRFGEAAALAPADVNLDAGTVHFCKTHSRCVYLEDKYSTGTPKTEQSDRTIRVPQKVLEKLDLSGEFVFTYKGEQVEDDKWRKAIWKPAIRRSGLPMHRQPRIHDLRHTHASRLLDAGIPLPAIQERLGHGDVMTTLRTYVHSRANVDDAILTALD